MALADSAWLWRGRFAKQPLRVDEFARRSTTPTAPANRALYHVANHALAIFRQISIKMGNEDAVYLAKLAEQAERYEGT